MTPRTPATDTVSRAPEAPTANVEAASRASESAPLDRVMLAWLTLALVGLGGFAAITILFLNGWIPAFDRPLLDGARQWQNLAPLWRVISESANIPLIVIGVGMVLVLFFTKHRREAVLVALILIAITAGSEAVKQLVHRDRPSGTDPNIPGVVYSFPSGHVLEALAIFGMLAIRAVRSHIPQLLAGLIVLAVFIEVDLVALARVALAAHWPSDTIASYIGGLGVLGVYGLFTHRAGASVAADPGAADVGSGPGR